MIAACKEVDGKEYGLRMNHVWGARMQNWSTTDTVETLTSTVYDASAIPLLDYINLQGNLLIDVPNCIL